MPEREQDAPRVRLLLAQLVADAIGQHERILNVVGGNHDDERGTPPACEFE